MKKFIYLAFTPALFALASCGNGLPPRKSGQFVNVTFIGHDVTCNCPTFALMDRDLDLALDIPFVDHEDATWEIEPTKDDEGMLDKPVEEYYVSPEDIKITIGGKEYPDSWYFYYRHNNDNLLRIKKEYVVNDITIEVTSRPFGDLFLYGIVIGDEMWHRWVGQPIGTGYTHDLYIDLQTFYQRKPYPIKTISGQVTFPVLEHDNIDITFRVKETDDRGNPCPPLPDDIRFRCNSRYAYMGIDYTRE
ncbi:MAG: hypothetical protein MJ199_02430, partial [Bacilli bacterium]|nr:hypothetical protein [Bacilli bacterium]